MKKLFAYGDIHILKNYDEAIRECGAESVFSTDIGGAKDCDALLLAGGGDINPALYGEEDTGSLQIDPTRDRNEIALVHSFIENGKPILGICRGMQVLNVALGGSLIQHVKQDKRHAYDPESGDQTHLITCKKNSFLHTIYTDKGAKKLWGKLTLSVNSAHHQACAKAGEGLRFVAFSKDGIVEALENPEKRIYAVQFHPERMAFSHRREDTVDGRLIWEFFIRQI